MKTKIWLPVLAILLIATLGGCGSTPDEVITFRKVIPDSLKQEALNKIESLIATVKVQSRNDDEDVEDWINQAQETVEEIYGITVYGIGNRNNWDTFLPYDKCSDAQKKWIDNYLAEER